MKRLNVEQKRITLPIPTELLDAVTVEARRFGLARVAYIRMVLAQAVEKR